MENLTFLLPIKIDSEARINNAKFLINNLINLNAKILIVEQNDSPSFWELVGNDIFRNQKLDYLFVKNKNFYFNKCQLINEGVKLIDTDYFAIHDIDTYFYKHQYVNALDLLNKGESFVFPYDGTFINVPENYLNENNTFIINTKYKYKILHYNSPGGCLFINKKDFIEIGMMNSNFIAWGHEDDELIVRAEKLGYNIIRTCGECYHFDHPRSENSSSLNKHYENNKKEYLKVKNMSKKQLIDYIIYNFKT